MLFGKPEELADYHRKAVDFTVVVTEKEDFEILSDNEFMKFLS